MVDIPDVLTSTRYVMEHARFVHIDKSAVRRWAETQTPSHFDKYVLPSELEFTGDRDTCANLTLLLSCLNFCFWSDEPWTVDYRGQTWSRTFAMMAAVLRGIDDHPAWLTPQRWATADHETVSHLFRGTGEIPLLPRRTQVLNETGRCLIENFSGRFTEAVELADGRACELAYILAEHFPSFRDVALYNDRPVALLKRAQICAADLHRLWRRRGHAGLTGIDGLTVFADYRLPQYLRHVGIISIDDELAERIEHRVEIPTGSPEEIELRCATIRSAELLRKTLKPPLPAWRLDYVLWNRSHDPDVSVHHHRTRTVFY